MTAMPKLPCLLLGSPFSSMRQVVLEMCAIIAPMSHLNTVGLWMVILLSRSPCSAAAPALPARDPPAPGVPPGLQVPCRPNHRFMRSQDVFRVLAMDRPA